MTASRPDPERDLFSYLKWLEARINDGLRDRHAQLLAAAVESAAVAGWSEHSKDVMVAAACEFRRWQAKR